MKPFITILRDSGRPELWLVTHDSRGLVMPVGATGPLHVPQEWLAELERAEQAPARYAYIPEPNPLTTGHVIDKETPEQGSPEGRYLCEVFADEDGRLIERALNIAAGEGLSIDAVHQAMGDRAKLRTSPENVSDVLAAIGELSKPTPEQVAQSEAEEREADEFVDAQWKAADAWIAAEWPHATEGERAIVRSAWTELARRQRDAAPAAPTDDELRRVVVLVPLYSDDTNHDYHVRLARAVLNAFGQKGGSHGG